MRVEMTGGNWGRTNDPDTDMTSLAYIVKARSVVRLKALYSSLDLTGPQ